MRSGWKRRARSEKEIERKPGNRETRRLFLVVCEDAKSSPAYFRALRSHLRLPTAQIEVCGEECGSAPINVIDFAVQKREERRRSGNPVDAVYCVIDVDQHPSLHQALNKAKANSLEVAITSPCFELWYLLHFAPGGRSYPDCDRLVRDLKKRISGYEKGTFRDFGTFWMKTDLAIAHARQLVELRGKERLRNPSTEVHLVVEVFLAEAQSGPPTGEKTDAGAQGDAAKQSSSRR